MEGNRLCFQLPCYSEYTRLARSITAQVAKIEGFNKQEEFKIQLAVDEACSNIVNNTKHLETNGKAQIYVEFLSSIESLEIIIKDQGCGFDVDSVTSPVSGEKDRLMAERGRGLYIMANLMDSFEVHSEVNKGTQVKLVKFKQRRDD